MYRCGKCNEPIRDVNSQGLQCEKCRSRIVYKDRPNKKKTLKSD